MHQRHFSREGILRGAPLIQRYRKTSEASDINVPDVVCEYETKLLLEITKGADLDSPPRPRRLASCSPWA